MADPVISFFVPGTPRPGGSKTATVVRRKGGEIVMHKGRPLVTTRDAGGEKTQNWRAVVALVARQSFQGVPFDCPLHVRMMFRMPRPKCHYGSGKNAGVLKSSAPIHHTSKPDVLKLSRSTEDACTGILWRDDSCTAKLELEKVYGDRPGVQITVTPLADVATVPVPTPATLFERRAS